MKKFNVLVLKNKGVPRISDDIKKTIEYEEKNTPLKLTVDVVDVDIDNLKHTSFGIRNVQNGRKVEMYGLYNIKDRIRALKLIPNFKYHAVVFAYEFDKRAFEDEHPDGAIGHWTYFKQIQPETEFIEIATSKAWDRVNDFYRVLTHELRHAYVNRIRRAGGAIIDPMDATLVKVDCASRAPEEEGECTQLINYYKEFDVEAPDGNRAVTNKLITVSGQWYRVVDMPIWRFVIGLIQKAIRQMLEKKIEEEAIVEETKYEVEEEEIVYQPKKRLYQLGEAIKKHEGWYVGSRSYRNNNPGNLRWSKYQIGRDSGGYAIFKDYEQGWEALMFQLEIAKDGRSGVYSPEMTLREFFAVYAPSGDNNNPEAYAQAVADQLKVDITYQIKDFVL